MSSIRPPRRRRRDQPARSGLGSPSWHRESVSRPVRKRGASANRQRSRHILVEVLLVAAEDLANLIRLPRPTTVPGPSCNRLPTSVMRQTTRPSWCVSGHRASSTVCANFSKSGWSGTFSAVHSRIEAMSVASLMTSLTFARRARLSGLGRRHCVWARRCAGRAAGPHSSHSLAHTLDAGAHPAAAGPLRSGRHRVFLKTGLPFRAVSAFAGRLRRLHGGATRGIRRLAAIERRHVVGHAVLPRRPTQLPTDFLRVLPVEAVLRVAGLAAIDWRRLWAGTHAAHSSTHPAGAGLGLRREWEQSGD